MKLNNLKTGKLYQSIINSCDDYKLIYVFELERVLSNDYIVVNKGLYFKLNWELECEDNKGGLTGTDEFDKRTLKEVKDQKIIKMFNEKFK